MPRRARAPLIANSLQRLQYSCCSAEPRPASSWLPSTSWPTLTAAATLLPERVFTVGLLNLLQLVILCARGWPLYLQIYHAPAWINLGKPL